MGLSSHRFSRLVLLALNMILLMLAMGGTAASSKQQATAKQCYLNDDPDSSHQCALCWITSIDGEVTGPSLCPSGVSLRWLDPPPDTMMSGAHGGGSLSAEALLHKVRYKLSLRGKYLRQLVRHRLHAGESSVWDVPHANIHSCFAAVGACTPFVADTPGLATHTPALASNLNAATGSATFVSRLTLAPGTYTIIAHVRFFTSTGEEYNVAVGERRTVAARNSPPLPLGAGGIQENDLMQAPSGQCYLEDPAATCAVCWVTDSKGKQTVHACPRAVQLAFTLPPPDIIDAFDPVTVRYVVQINIEALPARIVPGSDSDGAVSDIAHANIHSCFNTAGACTPFVADTPGLATHTNAVTADLDPSGAASFAAEVVLGPGSYTIIAHARFRTLDDSVASPLRGCVDGTNCLKTYDISVGTRRTVKLAASSNDSGISRSPVDSNSSHASEEALPVSRGSNIRVVIGGVVAGSVSILACWGALLVYCLRHRTSVFQDKNVRTGSSTTGSTVGSIKAGLPLYSAEAPAVSAANLSCISVAEERSESALKTESTQHSFQLSRSIHSPWLSFGSKGSMMSTAGRKDPLQRSLPAAGELPRRGVSVDWRGKGGCGDAAKLNKRMSIKDKGNVKLEALAQPVVDLHEGMGEEYRAAPMRLLLASFVRGLEALLPAYEELTEAMGEGNAYVSIPYSAVGQAHWDATAIVSWRWAHTKPNGLVPGFSPLSGPQLTDLQRYLEQNRSIEFVWIDWACVPQYSEGCMVEVARSKLFYSRARMMIVLPVMATLPDGAMRVVLSGVLRALARRPCTKVVCLATSVLMIILEKGLYAEFGYFGRVWTLAERMARHGRNERLQNWVSLEAWLGMTLDALWAASSVEPEDGYKPGLNYYWGRLFDCQTSDGGVQSAIQELRLVRARGSNLASDSVHDALANLFTVAVEVWRNGFVTEALDVEWLKHYLQHDAGVVYQSFQPEDSVFAIYTFFCWHLRDEFSSAHNDLCLLAGLEEKHSKLWRYTAGGSQQGDDATVDGVSPMTKSVEQKG